MKKFLIELMNRILHFITHSIDWYDGLDEFIFFVLVFFLEKTAFDLLAFWILLVKLLLDNFRLLVGFLRLVCLLMVRQRYIVTSSSWSYWPAECSYRFLAIGITSSDDKCSSTTILYFFTWNSNHFLSRM